MADHTSTAAEIAQNLGGLVGGLVGGAFGLGWLGRFAWRKMAEEGTATQRAEGEGDVIVLLRAEVERLAGLNVSLSNMVGDLQQQVITLRGENGELTAHVRALTTQLQAMQQNQGKY